MDSINLLIGMWIVLICIIIYQNIDNKYSNKEGFTPKIRSIINPYYRTYRIYKESFLNKYNNNYFIKKLREMGIY